MITEVIRADTRELAFSRTLPISIAVASHIRSRSNRTYGKWQVDKLLRSFVDYPINGWIRVSLGDFTCFSQYYWFHAPRTAAPGV